MKVTARQLMFNPRKASKRLEAHLAELEKDTKAENPAQDIRQSCFISLLQSTIELLSSSLYADGNGKKCETASFEQMLHQKYIRVNGPSSERKKELLELLVNLVAPVQESRIRTKKASQRVLKSTQNIEAVRAVLKENAKAFLIHEEAEASEANISFDVFKKKNFEFIPVGTKDPVHFNGEDLLRARGMLKKGEAKDLVRFLNGGILNRTKSDRHKAILDSRRKPEKVVKLKKKIKNPGLSEAQINEIKVSQRLIRIVLQPLKIDELAKKTLHAIISAPDVKGLKNLKTFVDELSLEVVRLNVISKLKLEEFLKTFKNVRTFKVIIKSRLEKILETIIRNAKEFQILGAELSNSYQDLQARIAAVNKTLGEISREAKSKLDLLSQFEWLRVNTPKL